MIIEATIIEYLNSKLSNIEAYADVPEKPPKAFVIVEKTGSGRVNYLNNSTVAIQSYDESTQKAAELNEKIKELMYGIIELNEISACRLNSDYRFPDTARKKPRYQAVFDIYHY